MKYIFSICMLLFLVEPKEKPVYYICEEPRFTYVDGTDTIMVKTDYIAAIRCLRDFLTGEQEGGAWTQVSGPSASQYLIGSNPCWEWSGMTCGLYKFKYKIVTPCCSDSSIVTLRKCCLGVNITCQ